MDGSSHSCSQIGWTGVNVPVLLVQHEFLPGLLLDAVTHSSDATSKTIKYRLDITSGLHGDDPQLILFIDPSQECFILVVEDSSTLRPIALHTGDNQVLISRNKQEMVIYQLLTDLLAHPCQRKVSSSQVSLQVVESFLHQALHIETLLLGDSWRQSESINVSSHTDSGGMDWGLGIDVSLDLRDVHVRGVHSIGTDAMIVLDDGVKDVREDLVTVPISSVDTAVLVIKLDSTGNGLGQGEPRCSGHSPEG